MPQLSFETDWVEAEGISGPELSATWASLRIQAGDATITRVLDTRAKTVRDFVYVPLYPLAEWLATNWWFLTHEFGNPAKESDPAFYRRHALGPNREGYAFPDLEVVSSGARTRLAWKCDPCPWTRVEFLDQGEIWIESSELRESCADLVDRVIRRLASLGVDGTLLQEEWKVVQTADEEEYQFCKTAAGLGWDPYALDDVRRDWVLLLAKKLGDVLDEAVPALDTNDLYKDWKDWFAINDTIEEAKRFNSLPLERVRSFRDEARLDATTEGDPWSVGYDCARRLRRTLGLDGEPLPTIPHMAEALGEDAESIKKVTTQGVAFGGWPALVDGVITRNDDECPAFAFRRRGDHGRRFHFCRALAEVLLSPGSDTLLTRANSGRQQRNRAFAAEFLAPSSGLRERVSRPMLDGEDIDELAAEFGVSPLVVEHQVKNHSIAQVCKQI